MEKNRHAELLVDKKSSLFFHKQLHRCNYDHGKALQALVKSPALRSIEKKWTEDELVSISYCFFMKHTPV